MNKQLEKDTRTATGGRITRAQFDWLKKQTRPIHVDKTTTDGEAFFMLGVQKVLEVVEREFVR